MVLKGVLKSLNYHNEALKGPEAMRNHLQGLNNALSYQGAYCRVLNVLDLGSLETTLEGFDQAVEGRLKAMNDLSKVLKSSLICLQNHKL